MQVQALNEELERMREAQSGLRSQASLKGKYVYWGLALDMIA